MILDMSLSFPNNLKEHRFSGKACLILKLLVQFSTLIPTAQICFVVVATIAVIFTVYYSIIDNDIFVRPRTTLSVIRA